MKATPLNTRLLKALSIVLIPCFFAGCSSSDPVAVQPNPTPTQTVTVSTFAGSGSAGFLNGLGTIASFSDPLGVTIDPNANIYVADFGNYLIRKITQGAEVSTFAGTGAKGAATGPALSSTFDSPYAVAADAFGDLFIVDQNNLQIRKINGSGVVSAFAGSGTSGSANGIGAVASFSNLKGIACDLAGNVYATDGNSIRVISNTGAVSTLLTGGLLNAPTGIAVNSSGYIFVVNTGNNTILKIVPGAAVIAFAGSGKAGSANGAGTAASFNSPQGIAADASGNLYVTDTNNKLIREISSNGTVSTLAGGGAGTETNGTGTTASFSMPTGIAINSFGAIYVTDPGNNLIRELIIN